jgi:tetratricopeptide (TPR) repeat protein
MCVPKAGRVESAGGRARALPAIGVAFAALFVACLLTATLPALYGRVLVRAAESAWLMEGNPQKARGLLTEAARRDPLSPEPIRRLADLAYHRWRTSPSGSDAEFERVVELGKLAIDQDPHASAGYRTLAQRYAEAYQRTKTPQHAEAAAAYFEQAVRRYPNDATLRAEFASALAAADRAAEAGREADLALELDAINRREGHIDKLLPAETLQDLQNLRRVK